MRVLPLSSTCPDPSRLTQHQTKAPPERLSSGSPTKPPSKSGDVGPTIPVIPLTPDAGSFAQISAKADADVAAVEVSEFGPTYFINTDAATKPFRIVTVAAENISLKLFIPDKDVRPYRYW